MKTLMVTILAMVLATSAMAEQALSGSIFTNSRFGYQAYLKTIQGNWHYDAGQLVGFRFRSPFLDSLTFMKIVLEEAVIVDSMPQPCDPQINIGVVGQRMKLSVVADSGNFVRLELGYTFQSWCVSDTELYGPAYMINRDHTVHQIRADVELKLF